ncbi:MAG: hypothetical protein AAGM84_08430 [Pseudomonadota bacterium]
MRSKENDLPFADVAFGQVQICNVTYVEDETMLLSGIKRIHHDVKPGKTRLLTMLSRPWLVLAQVWLPVPREIGQTTRVVYRASSDEREQHDNHGAFEASAFVEAFGVLVMAGREHERRGPSYWHLTLERQA